MNTKRLVIVYGSIIAALLVVLIIVGIVLLNTMNAQREQDAYKDCMARHGFGVDAPLPSPEDEDAWIDAIAEAAEFCSR